MDIVNRVKELVFIGNTPSVPSVSEGLPYQHPGKNKIKEKHSSPIKDGKLNIFPILNRFCHTSAHRFHRFGL